MANNVLPFTSAAGIPAFLAEAADTNNDLVAHASVSMAVMSIKGKVFTLVQGGDRKVVPNPKDPESPATFIDVALVKVSPDTSKTYYSHGYTPDADDNKPTCFSVDGKAPDATAEEPQCKTCAACKWNAFGTARGENGQLGRGKACSDFIRVAIADPTSLDTPIMLRVPAASIRNLGEYGRQLERHHVPYQGVLTRISFDVEQATPRLLFRAVGYFDEPSYRQIVETAKGEAVDVIINGFEAPTEAPAKVIPVTPVKPVAKKPDTSEEAKTAAAEELIEKVVEAPKPKAEAPKKEAPAVIESADDLGAMLSNLGFD